MKVNELSQTFTIGSGFMGNCDNDGVNPK